MLALGYVMMLMKQMEKPRGIYFWMLATPRKYCLEKEEIKIFIVSHATIFFIAFIYLFIYLTQLLCQAICTQRTPEGPK